MLKYEVRLGKDNFKKDELVWKEKYLSPDLSIISGITSPNYHLEKFDKLTAANSINNYDGTLFVECENVQRQGFIVVKEKEYETYDGKTIDYSVESEGTVIDYRYLVNNGKYFYWGEITANTSGYTIDNLLNLSGDPNVNYEIVETKNVVCGKSDNPIKIDTLYWIEDGKVTIDGNTYFYERNEGNYGVLKYTENGRALSYSEITKCNGITFYPYDDINDYEEVTKFKLTKQDEIVKEFDKITFSKYFYYIKYKEHYCPIKKNITGDNFSFVCEIPKYVLSGGTVEENLEPIEFDVYFTFDNSDMDSYRAAYASGNKINSDENNYKRHNVKELEELVNVIAFVYIDTDDTFFTVEHTILNANSGRQIAVYLEDPYIPLKVGEKIKFINNGIDKHESTIYYSDDYNGKEDDVYAVYDGNKYKVIANICDKAIINNNEYSIDYINGKIVGKDCLVTIAGEKVPMNIKEVSDNGGTLQRYGKIVNNASNAASDVTYTIKSYSGITVNAKNYAIYDKEIEEGSVIHYAVIDLPPQYVFSIEEIVGSSMYVCKPEINRTEFTDDFGRYLSSLICEDVVDNQTEYELFVQNKIFGENEISVDLPFRATNAPRSSDDFYNLFNDLKIYVDNAYIHIPIQLSTNVANNTLQGDIVNKEFFEVEKEKSINPIVDMEKDVYIPKFIENETSKDKNSYIGAETTFKTISQINFNFHFRTRDLDSWKVNDGYNNIKYAADDSNESNDNWFVTDFYPYRNILSDSGDTLQQSSDLMGLLYFTNDDIFYQRSKVAKSFARLSFYDSTDPQTQSLLATSCVFIDEHKLFKTFIDNSRKYRYEYGEVTEPEYHKDSYGFIKPSATYVGGTSTYSGSKTDVTDLHKYKKISVKTELIGEAKYKDEEKNRYSKPDRDSKNIKIDESHRISSRLVVDNKYVTDTSSEGYYLYIFREYSENLHPKPIYMKIEFNHAGIGKQIPFVIPMDWTGNTNPNDAKYNKMYPNRTLKLENNDDLTKLKKGFPLSYVYAQTYIPLYAVYDFKNKEYAYVFDDRYVEQDCNGVLNINLFEMKIQNESEDVITANDQKLKDIKTNRQIRAIININESQFNKKYFTNNTQ